MAVSLRVADRVRDRHSGRLARGEGGGVSVGVCATDHDPLSMLFSPWFARASRLTLGLEAPYTITI